MRIRSVFFRSEQYNGRLSGKYLHQPLEMESPCLQDVFKPLQCAEHVKIQDVKNPAGVHTYTRASTKGKCVQSNMGAKDHAIANAKLKENVSSDFRTAGQHCMAHNTAVFVRGLKPWGDVLQGRLNVNMGIESGANIGHVISRQVGFSFMGSRASFAGGFNVYGKPGAQYCAGHTQCYSSKGKIASSDKRNILDHKRRLLAAKYELKRVLYKAVLRDPNLPRDMWEKFRTKLSKLPRNSSFTRVRN